jgi:hypothetical protein
VAATSGSSNAAPALESKGIARSRNRTLVGFNDLPPRAIPRPLPKPRRTLAIVAVYALAIGFGVALFSGHLPGFEGQITSNVNANGHTYAAESYYIPTPVWGENSTSPSEVVFHSLSFWIWVTNWGSPVGSYVHVNATETNGTSYALVLGGLLSSPNRTSVAFSPDQQFGAEWSGELFMQLLVELSPST